MAITAQERDQVLKIVAGLFNGAPGGTYLSDFSAAVDADMTPAELARVLAATNEFKQGIMGGKVTVEQQVAVLMNHFGVVADDVEGSAASLAHTFFTDSINANVDFGDIVYAAVVFLENDTSAEFAPYRDMLNNKAAVAVVHAENNTTIASVAAGQAILAGVTSEGPSTPEEITEYLAGVSGGASTFALTTGLDDIVGTSGNDTINANPGASNANTLTALDKIDGGAGVDTINVTEIGATGAGAFELNTAATIKNVEVLNYTVASDNVGDAVTADVSNWTGLTTANIVVSGTDAPVTLTTKGNVTAATVNGATTATITDSAAAGSDKLATVTLVDTTGAATVVSDVLTSLTLNGSSGGTTTVTAAAATRALDLNLNNVTGGTVTDAEATSLNITASGTKTTAGTVTTAKATTVSIAADEALTLTELNVAAATGLTVTGDSLVTLSDGTFTALTSIDASAQTAGGVDTSATALGTGVAFTGGAGDDSIKLGATTKAITTGAGNDRVALMATVTALGTGGSVDAGAGTTDTLAFLDADDAGTATAAATFAGTVSNFEVVELAGAAGAGVALNLANLDNISSVKLSANVNQALTISNMASGGTLAATVTQAGTTSVGVANAAVGTADVVNVSLAGAAVVNSGALTIADVETINYLTDDTATTPAGIVHVSNLTAAAAKTITVAGDAGLTLTNTAATVTSFDASGVTKGAVTWTTGILAGVSIITGGAGDDTLNAVAAVKEVTLNGGAGNDTLTGSSTKANTITGGEGNDSITGGSAVDIIDGGAGNDTISSGTGLDQITGGAGNDTFNIVANSNGNIFATITDAAAGDILSFVDKGMETFNTTQVTLGGNAIFQDFLNEAAKGNNGSAVGVLSWFQFGGNTYVVEDVSNGTSFVNNDDLVVELTGLIDLSTATGAGTHIITLA